MARKTVAQKAAEQLAKAEAALQTPGSTEKAPLPAANFGMEAFFTRGPANNGVRLPLYLPTGEKTEHWLHILGIDSDSFRQVNLETMRDMARIVAITDQAERAREMDLSKVRLVACLIHSWSFDLPCSEENRIKLLQEAPHLRDMIDKSAGKRALFFGTKSPS